MSAIARQPQRATPLFRAYLLGSFTLHWRVASAMAEPAVYTEVAPEQWGKRRQAMRLLAVLLARPGRRAGKDFLIELFWPDTEPEQAAVYLTQTVAKLRKVLRLVEEGESLLIVERAGYRLGSQEQLWVDADAAEALLQQASEQGADRLPLLQEAVTLLQRGPFLEEAEGTWVLGRRGRLQDLRKKSQVRLAQLLAQQGRLDEAETQLSTLLEEDPTDEDVLCSLMELLHRQGMTHQAIRVYERSCEVCAREGIELTEATTKLAAQLTTSERRSSTPDALTSFSLMGEQNRAPTSEQRYKRDRKLNEANLLLLTEQLQTTDMSSVLTGYLERQLAKLLDTLASGSTHLSVREIVKPDGLFIPPLWNLLNAETPQVSLVDYLLEHLSKHHWILLLGEAGQGKTTVLKQVFTLLAQRFLSHSSSFAPLPLYIPLREISSFTGTAVEVLWAYIQDEFPLSFINFASLVQNHRLIMLFDGLDEIQSELAQHTINEHVASRLFALPAILSCRKSFYESYLSLSTLHERYFSKIELQPLALNDSVKNYISTFCQRKQEHSPNLAVTIVNLLHSSPRLQSLAQRPLLLTMMLDIFTDQQERGVQDWSQAKLYQKYTEKWLKYEAAKPNSVLKWNEKLILMQEIAWAISRIHIPATSPYSLYQNVTFTQRDLFFWLEHMKLLPGQVSISHLVDDLCFRTFLISNDGDTYSFIHKSFQEYFAARFIFEHLRGRNQTVETAACALQQMLPVEVVGFLKEMFSTLEFARHDREGVISLLIEVYQHHAMSDRTSVTIRQNACAYLAYIGTPRAIQFLEQRYEQESNKWVQRGMMVGLALFCGKTTILERYVEMIQTDPEVASINLGFHLIYYGDQAPENGYYDQGGEQWEGTVRSIFRRLRSEHYKDAWALDLATLRTLLHTRGRQILSQYDQNISFLEQFLRRNHLDQGKVFQQEQQQLLKILQGAF